MLFLPDGKASRLRVKWVDDPNYNSNEGHYLDCMENLIGYKFKYNKIAGTKR